MPQVNARPNSDPQSLGAGGYRQEHARTPTHASAAIVEAAAAATAAAAAATTTSGLTAHISERS